MAYSKDKFIITKGMSNEFTITIKQNGTTLPMQIMQESDTFTKYMTPDMDYHGYVAPVDAVEAIEARDAVAGQEYIAEMEGATENYKIYFFDPVDAETYDILIDETTYSLLYEEATYDDKYDYLLAMVSIINDGSGDPVCIATLDENNIILTGRNDGVAYTVNGSDVFDIVETQKAIAPVAGQEYIEAVSAVEAVEAVPAEDEVLPYYTATGSDVTISISDEMVKYDSVTEIKMTIDEDVSAVTVDENAITAEADGSYVVFADAEGDNDAAIPGSVLITPNADTNEYQSRLQSIDVNFEVTTTTSADEFVAKLIKLDDGTELEPSVSIYDGDQGKIKVIFNETMVDGLVSSKGDAVDRYYLKPVYKLLIDCDTLHNGQFIAKVPEVYVE